MLCGSNGTSIRFVPLPLTNIGAAAQIAFGVDAPLGCNNHKYLPQNPEGSDKC